MKKYILLLLTGLFTLQIYAQIASSGQNQRYYDINKNIDIFNSVLRELDMFYVDSIEVNKLVQGTIHNMLSRLDPYTEYYSEENIGELQFMTTGEYAGIGAIISYKDGQVIINEPYRFSLSLTLNDPFIAG
jgi:carboxyl-terminal processing protease